jgi:hypothetical protein
MWLIEGGADLIVKDEGRTALDESIHQLEEVASRIRARLPSPDTPDYGLSEIRLQADRATTYAGTCPVTFKFSAEFSAKSDAVLKCKFRHENDFLPFLSGDCKVQPGLNKFEESRTLGTPGQDSRASERFEIDTAYSKLISISISCRDRD